MSEAVCDVGCGIVQAYCESHSVDVRSAVDVGCAGGESSRRLAATIPEAKLTGVDLSPYFLGLAEMRRRSDSNAANWPCS